jgi:hypothetical protein
MEYSTKIGLVIGALVVIGGAWAIWKFFKSLFKYFVIGLIVIALGVGLTIYRMIPPAKNPAIGKHAYLKENGKYLGVVEGQGDDTRRGEVWAIRPPGGHQKMYSKSRVELKDTYEPAAGPPEESALKPEAKTPAAKAKKGSEGKTK